MPETTKSYADMEILQGVDFDMDVELDSATTSKSYLMFITKDFTGDVDFGGSNSGGTPYRTEVNETGDNSVGKLTASDTAADGDDPAVYKVNIKLYAVWTETLDDGFDGHWELVEKSGTSYNRIVQGDFYVNNSVSRYASISARSD